MSHKTDVASKRAQATWQTQPQQTYTEVSHTEEAYIMYDEERTSPEQVSLNHNHVVVGLPPGVTNLCICHQVSVSLDKARLEDRKPSFVTIREQVVSPHEAEELPAEQVLQSLA